jgi:hypothetical protein
MLLADGQQGDQMIEMRLKRNGALGLDVECGMKFRDFDFEPRDSLFQLPRFGHLIGSG